MSRRLVINLVLIALVAGLAALLFLPGLFDQTRTQGSSTSSLAPLGEQLDLADGGPSTVRVRRGSDQIRLARADGAWRMISPANARPDAAHLALIKALRSTPPERQLADTTLDSEVSGLDTPLVVQYDDRPPVRIGGPGPTGATRYVAAAGALWLVALPHYDTLSWHWTDWLDRALVPESRRLTRIVLPDYTLSRTHDTWTLAPKGRRPAAAADATAAAWQRAAALAVVPADHRRERLSRVTLVFADDSQKIYDVIERGPNLILRDDALDVDYHLAGNRIDALLNLVHPGLSK